MHDENHRTRTLWLCTALHAFTHIYQVALIPLYLRIQSDFHLESAAQATFLVTILNIAYFLPSYPMGVLSDRMSRKKLLGLGLAINAVGYIGLSFAPNYLTAVAFAIIAGLGGSFFHPAATSLIAGLYPTGTGKALGRVALGASLGFFVGPFYAGWRESISHSWRTPVLELGIAGLVGAFLFMRLAEEKTPAKTAARTSASPVIPRKMFETRWLWFSFLVMAFLFCLRDFAGSGMASLSSLFLQQAHHFSPSETGLTLSCLYIASMISNPLFGHLSDRGRARWTTFLLVSAAITIFTLPHIPVEWFSIILAAYGFFFMASYPIVEAALMESVHDSVRGRVFGCFITIGGLLGNLSHWFVGDWIKQLGTKANLPASYIGIFNIMAFCVLGSILALIFLNVIRRKRTPGTSALTPQTAIQPSPLP